MNILWTITRSPVKTTAACPDTCCQVAATFLAVGICREPSALAATSC